jgi:hypothetical protein
VQSSIFIKDPIGSTLWDFIIQPLILGDSIRPQGQFGQPLYPIDATALDKVGYGIRAGLDPFIPRWAAYGGLAVPSDYAKYIPIYGGRAISNAVDGKNQMGISTKEPKVQKTIRELVKRSGFPAQPPVNTAYTQGSE